MTLVHKITQSQTKVVSEATRHLKHSKQHCNRQKNAIKMRQQNLFSALPMYCSQRGDEEGEA